MKYLKASIICFILATLLCMGLIEIKQLDYEKVDKHKIMRVETLNVL